MSFKVRNTICLGTRVRFKGDQDKFLRLASSPSTQSRRPWVTVRAFPTAEGDHVIGLVVNHSAPERVINFNINRPLLTLAQNQLKKKSILPSGLTLEISKLELEILQEKPSWWVWSDGSEGLAVYVAGLATSAGEDLGDSFRGVELARIPAGAPAASPLDLDAPPLKKLAKPLLDDGVDAKQLWVVTVGV